MGPVIFVLLVLFQILPEFELKFKFKLKFKLKFKFIFILLWIYSKSCSNSNSCLSLNSKFSRGPDHPHRLPCGPTTPRRLLHGPASPTPSSMWAYHPNRLPHGPATTTGLPRGPAILFQQRQIIGSKKCIDMGSNPRPTRLAIYYLPPSCNFHCASIQYLI
jgi:hypothetical protein